MNLEQLKPILINFDTLKKGDKLYHSALGEVEVNGLNNDILYPIEIIYYNDFVGGFTVLNFMKDGTFSHDCKNPSLFTENPFEYIIKGLKHPAKGRDEWIEVKSEKDLPTEPLLCATGLLHNDVFIAGDIRERHHSMIKALWDSKQISHYCIVDLPPTPQTKTTKK